MSWLSKMFMLFALTLPQRSESQVLEGRFAAEQHVVRERQHTKKSRKQRLKELQRKAFEGK